MHPSKKREKSNDAAEVKYLFSPEENHQQTRVALFVLSLLNFSVEVEQVTEGVKSVSEAKKIEQPFMDVDGTYSWNTDMMMLLAVELQIPEQFVEVYKHLLPTTFSPHKSELHDGYLSLISAAPVASTSSLKAVSSDSASLKNVFTISKLAIFLIVNGFYNARGRAYIQNMCAAMSIPSAEFISMERNISMGLSHIQASLSRLQKEGEAKGKKGHDYKRYAKIGVVSVGAGALLAFTGGLAAPAVAAALVVFGTSTAVAAAAFTSATVMSGLFGSAGMSLAGYKMAKRTRGISEFVFESEEHFGSKFLLAEKDEKSHKENDKESGGKFSSMFDKMKGDGKKNKVDTTTSDGECKINPLSVMICVSGWMIGKEDYKKSFGIVPHKMSDEERLRRFYLIHSPQKAVRAAEDIWAWKNSGCTSGSADMEKQGHKEEAGSSFYTSFKSLGSMSTVVGGGNDVDEFFQNMADIYGADPRVVESLIPPPLFPSQASSRDLPPPPPPVASGSSDISGSPNEKDAIMTHVLESITIALDNKKRADEEIEAKLADAHKQHQHPCSDEVKMRLRSPPPSPAKKPQPHKQSKLGNAAWSDSDDDKEVPRKSAGGKKFSGSSSSNKPATNTNASAKDTDETEVVDTLKQEEEEEEEKEKKSVDVEEVVLNSSDTEERLESDFWHWNQTELSGVYELNLLRWETPMQLELGKSIQQMLKDLTEAVTTKVLQATVLAALMTAVIVPYSIMRFMDKIDNIWDIATERADAAGVMLARVLLKRPQGNRSVVLVGHSIGARLVFSCLRELHRCKQVYLEERVAACRREAKAKARREGGGVSEKDDKKTAFSSMVSGMKSMFSSDDEEDDTEDGTDTERQHSKDTDKRTGKDNDKEGGKDLKSNQNDPSLDFIDRRLARRPTDVEDFSVYDFKHADNLVQDVVLLGTPNSASRTQYTKARAVVTGRFINGYSKYDFILALIYRYNKLAISVAGLREIHVDGVENIDFSETVKKHTDYCLNMNQILETVNLLGAADPANMYMQSAVDERKKQKQKRGDIAVADSGDERDSGGGGGGGGGGEASDEDDMDEATHG